MAEAHDALLVAEGLGKRLPQGDAHVLHRVMGVHWEVPAGGHGEVEAAVGGEAGQHVVEEAAA